MRANCLNQTPIVDDMQVLEDDLKERFTSKHLHGEWFTLSTEDIEMIKNEYSMVAHSGLMVE